MDWLLILSSLLLPVVPLFFFPGCVCCGTPCGTGCSDFPAGATVTFTGFSNGACLVCSNYNATYILAAPTVSGNDCVFSRTSTAEFCLGQHFISVSITLTAGNTVLTVTNSINSGAFPNDTIVLFQSNLGSGPIACDSIGTINVPMSSTPREVECLHDGSDAVVTV